MSLMALGKECRIKILTGYFYSAGKSMLGLQFQHCHSARDWFPKFETRLKNVTNINIILNFPTSTIKITDQNSF